MSVAVNPGITIRRHPRDVASVIFDPRYDASWSETIRVVEDGTDAIEPGPIQQRAIQQRAIRFLLRDVVVSLRVTGRDPERFIEWQTADPFPVLIRLDLEGIPEGTLVRIRIDAEPDGASGLLRGLVGRRLRRSLIGDLTALKALVENSVHPGIAAARPAAPVP